MPTQIDVPTSRSHLARRRTLTLIPLALCAVVFLALAIIVGLGISSPKASVDSGIQPPPSATSPVVPR